MKTKDEAKTGRVRPLSSRQNERLAGVVEDVRGGECLYVACRHQGIRYETALRGLGLPTGGATVTTAALERAVFDWHNVQGHRPADEANKV